MERLLATDPRGDVAGLVHPQLEPARQVALGLVQLVGRDQLVAEPDELVEDRPERLAQARRIDPGRDLERAGVGVVDEARADVVGQAALLAHRQEQAAAHPVAEDRVEERERPAVGVVAAQAGQPDDELGLGRSARLPTRTRSPAGSAGAGSKPGIVPLPVPNAAAARSTASACSMSPATATTVLAGRYVVAQKSRIVVVGQGPDARLVAADLAAQRPVAEERGLEQGLGVLGRIVLVGADLLDDDRPLAVDLLASRTRPDDELAEDVHRARRLAPRDADPVDGRLAVGGGVERAADALDRLADRPRRRVGRRALERDVLHEMGDAGLGRGFQARTGQDVCRDGDRTRPGHPGADDARPRGQRGPFEHRGRWYRNAVATG